MYTLTQREFSTLKMTLTKAQRRFQREETRDNALKLRETASDALKIFHEKGYPDAWSRWQRAYEDAEYYLLRTA